MPALLPGVESFDGSSYRRSLNLPHGNGIVTLSAPGGDPAPAAPHADAHADVHADLHRVQGRPVLRGG